MSQPSKEALQRILDVLLQYIHEEIERGITSEQPVELGTTARVRGPTDDEVSQLRAALAEAERERGELKDSESIELITLRTTLSAARELLREAIPHVRGKGSRDWAEKVDAHLEKTRADTPPT